MLSRKIFLALMGVLLGSLDVGRAQVPPAFFANTEPLQIEGDISSDLVAGVDRFLLKQLAEAPDQRKAKWPKPKSGASGSDASAGVLTEQWNEHRQQQRSRLKTIVGMRDVRIGPKLNLEREPHANAGYAEGVAWKADRARWTIFDGFDANGLWVQPQSQSATKFRAIVIPDAGQSPEQMIGIGEGAENVKPLAAQLASMGGEVIVTNPISRHRESRRGRAKMTDQEFIYRSAFELGRGALAYQLHEVFAAIDAFPKRESDLPIVVFGWGEGGWVALYAAALSDRISATCVSGHFQSRQNMWQEPIHRNMHGILLEFGDAELAALVAPKKLIIDAIAGPSVEIGGEGGAPGRLNGPTLAAASDEFARTQAILTPWKLDKLVLLIAPENEGSTQQQGVSSAAVAACLRSVGIDSAIPSNVAATIANKENLISAQARRQEMLTKWDRYSQQLLDRSADERVQYWKNLKTDSAENFKSSVENYRTAFRDEVIGRWDLPMSPPKPRSRLVYDKPKYLGYEVVMDVFPDVIAYGVLLMPRDIGASEKRPCVVFQHGLEGRPKDCIEGDNPAYHDVAARLAERGFVVFAPQNLYIFQDRFRTLQRKSNPLGKTLFSTIIPQHSQICKWLGSLPQVDASRIAFYGLSYGGKSAMRIPPLVPEYCLSICSADFNDWVWKNASSSSSYSYVWTGEYEIFEFDLGSRFNYAEMATLIAPRPFMVERGHFDGVGPDDRVAAEFAKVRHMYSAKLGLTDHVRLEWFVGPHTINGKGTYEFLHEKLSFPSR